MKLELDLNSSQNSTLINHSENDLGSEEIKKMLRSGISLAKEGNRTEARQMLLGVTEVEPNNETAWLWLASISEYPEELLVFLQNVLKVNPENERALEWAKQTKSLLSKTFVQRGINAAQNNQKEFAKQCFLQGIVHDSENEMAWLWLASNSDSQEEKVSHLQQVLRINPDNETAVSSLNAVRGQQSQGLLKKASSAAVSGDHEAARQTLSTVMKNSPNLEEAWILKAFLATDFYEKVECYEKALEINPECEAAQAGLASLKMLMPKMPKPAVEEVKEEEVAVAANIEEPVKEEEVVEDQVVEEAVAAPEITFAQEAAHEAVEFDETFDLEQLVEEPLVETVNFEGQAAEEIKQEEPQPESRAFAEEVFLERQQEETAIHETQTGSTEDSIETLSQPTQIEPIFNYEEVISQEESFAEESQAESVLEFDQLSDNPTQELEEEFAVNAALAFEVSSQEKSVHEAYKEDEVVSAPEQELAAEKPVALEDFYTEEAETEEVKQETVAEESSVVQPKAEVRVTETYVTEVNAPEIYDSEFFANDGFVLVPQNDPFADHTKETVEFSYSEEIQEAVEAAEVQEAVETTETDQVIEAQQAGEVEPVAETQAVEEAVELVAETQEVEEVAAQVEETLQAEQVVETVAESLQTEQVVETEQIAEVEQPEETQEVVEAKQSEEVFETQEEKAEEAVEAQFEQVKEETQFEQVEELEQTVETQQSEQAEELSETQSFAQAEEVEYAAVTESLEVEQVAATESYEAVEQVAPVESYEEVEQVAAVEETVAAEQFDQTEPLDEKVEETARFEQNEAAAEETSEAGQAETQKEYAQLVSEMESIGAQPSLTQCPFCAAENEAQAVVCNSCQAMLSLADLEVLISHQGVNQELLLQAIEKMEVEKSLRYFNAEELTYLAIAHLNAKNLEKGLGYLKDASALNPNDVILTSKIKFLTAHLEELKENKFKNAENPAGNRTILVVDDSPTVRKLISGKLEKCGHSVLAAVDGMDALAKINEVIPDLILLDITMPRLDGYQVCKLIRNNEMTKDVPIVMISGKDGFFDKVRGRMAGSSGYITKPFGPDTLMKTIETYLG